MKPLKLSLLLLICFFVAFLPRIVNALDYTSTPGVTLIGQPDFDSNIAAEKGLWLPTELLYLNGKLFLSEKGPCRVGVYNSIPTSNFTPVDYAVGQQNGSVQCASFGTPTAKRINQTWSVTSDGTKLIVSDSGNHRILIFNTIPTTGDATADVVLGQPNMTSNTANNGGLSASSIQSFTGADSNNSRGQVYTDGTKLFFTDTANHRVLIWNTIPTTNNAPADVVVGQPNMNSNTPNNGGISAARLNGPRGVKVIGGKLYVSDSGNNRVLIWNTVPTTPGVAADLVLGQPNMTGLTANNGGISGASLSAPMYVNEHGGKLYIADSSNNRVLIWNTIPTVSTTPADVALGQPSLGVNSSNNGGISASSLSLPVDAKVIDGKLLISDYNNHRVKIHNTIPTSHNASADIVIGQPNTTSNTIGFGGFDTFARPIHHIAEDGKFFVVDQINSRVLIWNQIPSQSYPLNPDYVWGQPNLTSGTVNNGGRSASTLYYPTAVTSCSGKYAVSDYLNSRVLIYNEFPTTNGEPADVVLGQSTFSGGSSNSGGISDKSLYAPNNVTCDGGRLIVTDTWNNRVLIWNTVPTTSFAPADVVVGQPNFGVTTQNNGGISNKTLFRPYGAAVANGTKLMIADGSNHRILIWNTVPTTNFAPADIVLGQPDFGIGTPNNGGLSASSLKTPTIAYSDDGERLFVVDTQNNRILGWSTFPTTNGAAADFVMGQDGFDVASETISNTGMLFPYNISAYNGKVYVSDIYNNRIMAYPFGPQNIEVEASEMVSDPSLTLQISAEGAKDMQISSSSDFTGSSWEPFGMSKTVGLQTEDGIKTVYVKLRDYANYTSDVLAVNTVLDRSAPTGSVSIYSPTFNSRVRTNDVSLTLFAEDNLTGVAKMRVSTSSDFSGSKWESYSETKTFSLNSEDGIKYVYAQFKDVAGNVSETYSDSVTLDSVASYSISTEIDSEGYVIKEGESIIIKGTGESGTVIVIKLGENIIGSVEVDESGTWEWVSGRDLELGEYTLNFVFTDPAGNVEKTDVKVKVLSATTQQVTDTPTQVDNQKEEVKVKKGFSWLWILILVATFVSYRVYISIRRHK